MPNAGCDGTAAPQACAPCRTTHLSSAPLISLPHRVFSHHSPAAPAAVSAAQMPQGEWPRSVPACGTCCATAAAAAALAGCRRGRQRAACCGGASGSSCPVRCSRGAAACCRGGSGGAANGSGGGGGARRRTAASTLPMRAVQRCICAGLLALLLLLLLLCAEGASSRGGLAIGRPQRAAGLVCSARQCSSGPDVGLMSGERIAQGWCAPKCTSQAGAPTQHRKPFSRSPGCPDRTPGHAGGPAPSHPLSHRRTRQNSLHHQRAPCPDALPA